MFDSLTTAYPLTDRRDVGDVSGLPEPVRGVLAALGGATLAGGFYRFHTVESALDGNRACNELIRGFAGAYHVFAFDWLGRELAVDVRGGQADGNVIMVDPEGAEYLHSDVPLSQWHDVVADQEEDPLVHRFFMEWRAANPTVGDLRFDQAVGYKQPLFLGGADAVENLELSDRDVYFSLCTQIAQQLRGNQ
ncbi:T6SS immunity protein Tdi1 domain-containing protein [Streptacidiphilus anmyonensis]|uniref:T6SS immunity protein Tdi1 domain-containing protein n=1 Tax=Streptacidiphilus anmyonensis TaxID=405782 RepID=UPI00069409EE|nr:T6SS immunity protein Tdi1 domain-containing protein [Streptacidiphilus anmyonensis]